MARNIRCTGPEARLAEFCAALSQHDINYRRLGVTGAAHSALLEPILDRFQEACAGLLAEPGQIPLISTLIADVIDESTIRRTTGADTCASRYVYPEYSGGACELGARIFLRQGLMLSWLLAGSANIAITHTG